MPELRAKFTADDTDFQRKLGHAERGVGRFGGMLGGLQGRLAGAFGVGAVTQLIRSVTSGAEEIRTIADSTGFSPKFIAGMQALGEERGVAEKITLALNRLSSAPIEALADRSSEAAKNLRTLGISASELKTLAKDPEAFVYRFAKAMSQAEGNARKLDAALAVLGGVRSKGVTTIIKDLGEIGPAGFDAKFGKQLPSESELASANKADAAIDRGKREITKLGYTLVNTVVNAVDMMDGAAERVALMLDRADRFVGGAPSASWVIPNNLKELEKVTAEQAGFSGSGSGGKSTQQYLAETNALLRQIANQPQGVKQ